VLLELVDPVAPLLPIGRGASMPNKFVFADEAGCFTFRAVQSLAES
jgi:hypothetical protein